MPFLGMKGTGQFATDERPKNWREMILYLYPNGAAPLTAMLSMMGSETTDDYEFNWWTKTLPKQKIDVTAIYTDVALATAYSGDALTAGATVYVKGSEAQVSEFRPGHQVMLRQDGTSAVDTNGKVTDRVLNGASSYIAVRLLEDTDSSNDLDDVDIALIIGNVNSQGASIPQAISYEPEKFNNFTQIFRTPLSITRTARRTRLRTGDAYQEMKREALELHAIEMEKAFLWSIKSENTGSNGQPETTTRGLVPFIREEIADNVDDFQTNTTYSGKTWLQGGEDWLDEQLEKVFRYGDTEKLGICGSGALLGLNRLSKVTGQVQLTPMTTDYGLQVVNWLTPFGSIYLKTHPLYSYESSNRNAITILEPRKLKYRYIDDTTFISDPEDRVNRNRSVDGTEEEFLTECGLEQHHPPAFGELTGVGQDNSL